MCVCVRVIPQEWGSKQNPYGMYSLTLFLARIIFLINSGTSGTKITKPSSLLGKAGSTI